MIKCHTISDHLVDTSWFSFRSGFFKLDYPVRALVEAMVLVISHQMFCFKTTYRAWECVQRTKYESFLLRRIQPVHCKWFFSCSWIFNSKIFSICTLQVFFLNFYFILFYLFIYFCSGKFFWCYRFIAINRLVESRMVNCIVMDDKANLQATFQLDKRSLYAAKTCPESELQFVRNYFCIRY